jgi:hypothetical protein
MQLLNAGSPYSPEWVAELSLRPRCLAADGFPPRSSQLVVRGAQPPPSFLRKLAVNGPLVAIEPQLPERVEIIAAARKSDLPKFGPVPRRKAADPLHVS